LIVDTVRELRALARIPKLSKPQRAEARALMRMLRELGFTNADVSVLVDGRWKEPTIKKDTRGVKTVSTDERDKLLRLVSDVADGGGTIQDLEDFLSYKIILYNLGVDYVGVITLVRGILRDGNQVVDLVYIKNLLDKSGLSVEDIIKHTVDMESLNRQGIFDQELNVLINLARIYGSFEGIQTALGKYGNIEAVKNTEILTRHNLSVLQSDYSKLEEKMKRLKPFVDFAEILIMNYSFNLESLDLLVQTAKKFGGFPGVLNALTEYSSLHNLRNEKAKEIKIGENLRIQTDAATLELINLSEKVREMHQDIGEIKANYAQSLQLQNIQDLLIRPREAEMDSTEFLRLVSALLLGMLEYGESNKESVKDWDKVKMNVELCRVKINDILVGF
jgi:hypothetical protein